MFSNKEHNVVVVVEREGGSLIYVRFVLKQFL